MTFSSISKEKSVNQISQKVQVGGSTSPFAISAFWLAIGLGSLLAWENACFFSTVLFSPTREMSATADGFYLAAVISHATCLLLIAFLFGFFPKKLRIGTASVLMGALAISCGTCLSSLATQIQLPNEWFYLGSVLSGCGSAILLIFWGKQLCPLAGRHALMQVSLAFAIASGLFLVFSLISGKIPALIFVVALPLASAFAGWYVRRRKGKEPLLSGHTDFRGLLKFSWRMLLGVVVFSFAFGFIRTFGTPETTGYLLSGRIAFGATLLLFAGFAVAAKKGNLKINTAWMYRMGFPLILAGLLLLVVGTSSSWFGYATALVGHTCVKAVLIIVLAELARNAKAPTEAVFACGMTIDSLFTLLGITASGFLNETTGFAATHSSAFVLGLIYLIVILSVFLIGDKQVFAGLVPKADNKTTIRNKVVIAAREFGLTEREEQILDMFAQGRNNPKIAEELYISQSTVKVHAAHIYQKLGVESRQEALDILQKLEE